MTADLIENILDKLSPATVIQKWMWKENHKEYQTKYLQHR